MTCQRDIDNQENKTYVSDFRLHLGTGLLGRAFGSLLGGSLIPGSLL